MTGWTTEGTGDYYLDLIMNVDSKRDFAREGFEQRWTTGTAFTSFGSLTAFTGGGGGAGAKSLNHCVEDSLQRTKITLLLEWTVEECAQFILHSL